MIEGVLYTVVNDDRLKRNSGTLSRLMKLLFANDFLYLKNVNSMHFLDQTTPLFNHDSHFGCKLHALSYFTGTQIRIGFNGIIIVTVRCCYSPVENIPSAWYNSSGKKQCTTLSEGKDKMV